jgi:hypothetical protein
MMKQITFFVLWSGFFILTVGSVQAEHSPYVGQELREIKSLSPARIAGLLAGKGLGYAKVAELNGFPGPAHVLALADDLELSKGQQLKTKIIFDAMQATAKQLGAQLLEAERQLDVLFKRREVSEAVVLNRLENIAALEGQLRATHVNAHLKQAALLTQHQIHQYNRLRGYVEGTMKQPAHHHHHDH